jgi:chitinase
MAHARRRPASVLLLAALLSTATFLAVPAAATGKTGQVAVFWGRNKDEGSLREACDTGTYTIAIISFLDVFGHGNYHLDLSGHDVSTVGADIKHCQSKNILVFLSIGGFGSQYSLPSPQSAADVANYLWNVYMLGTAKGVYRPFGDAFVDGIDFFIQNGPPDNYDELAKRLWNFNKDYRSRTPVQLTATPRCAYPDRSVQRALATRLFTRIFVRFYDDAHCAAYWQQEWDKWTAAYPSPQIFLGLPASAHKLGYVQPKNLQNGVIPVVQKAGSYGGVMIWERYEDKRTGYSSHVIQWA